MLTKLAVQAFDLKIQAMIQRYISLDLRVISELWIVVEEQSPAARRADRRFLSDRSASNADRRLYRGISDNTQLLTPYLLFTAKR